MRRYTVEIDGHDHEVDVVEVTANTFEVTIAGRQVKVRLRDHQSLDQASITPQLEVRAATTTLPAAPRAERTGRPASSASSAPVPTRAPGGSANTMTAPMPGVVLSIIAEPGQQVRRGDPLLVLEAMKMKNQLKAARDGTIAAINVAVGAQVKFGDALVTFER